MVASVGEHYSYPPLSPSSSLGSRAAGFQRLERLASELQDCLSTEVTSQGTEVASQGTEGTSQGGSSVMCVCTCIHILACGICR